MVRKIILATRKAVIPSVSLANSKKQIADMVFDLVAKEIKKFPEIIGLEFGGSYAKGTWLPKEADIDIFVRFRESTTQETFEKISKEIGFSSMKKFNPYIRYSEHPYVEAVVKRTKVNVVPCYDVKIGKWKSAADRSPFHTKHMQDKLNKKMKDEVRLLKTFLKSVGIYGAEIARQGFSGYVSEVLILNYGTFENTIKEISKIKQNQVIGKTTKTFDTQIVIIDPIDTNRNLAAAISNQNIGRFVLACRAFLAEPNTQFFKTSKRKKSNDWKDILVVKFNFKPRSPDIIWGQIKRAATLLSTQMGIGGFNVLRNLSYTDEKNEAYLLFLLESSIISKKYVKKGPEYFREQDSMSFIRKNIENTKLMWVDNDSRINSLEERKHNDVRKFIQEFLKSNLQTGIPNGLQDDLKQGFTVSIGGENLRKSIKEAVSELVSTDENIFYSN